LCTGFSNFGFPFVSPICLRYPKYQRHILVIGWAGCVLSLVLASFATQVWQLILFQGVMYGVSWPLCYTPFLLMCNEWFVKRRGTVYGIIYGASGIGGIVLPFVLEGLLGAYGFRVTLRATAALIIAVTGPGLWFVRPPKHASGRGIGEKGFGTFGFTKNKAFWIFAIPVFVQALSFYQPRFFLPEYAHTIGLSHAQGATLLALYNIAQFSGQMGLGYLSDKVNIYIPVTLSTAVPALSALLLWGTAKSFSPLAFFSVLCGSFGAAYSVLWSAFSQRAKSSVLTQGLGPACPHH
jgi:MFS family permease